MRFKSLFALAAAAIVVWAAWPTDADAQSRRGAYRSGEAYPGARVRPRVARTGRTRVTVQRGRSFLDPGTETIPGDRSYTNYALPPLGGADRAYDPTGSRRFPLPDSFDLPRYNRY